MNSVKPELSSQPVEPSAGEIPGLARVADLNERPNQGKPTVGQPPGGAVPAAYLAKNTLLSDMIGGALGKIGGVLSGEFVERSLAWARNIGHYAVLGGAALTLLYSIYAAIRLNSFYAFLAGIGMIAGIAVAQFAAQKFLHAADVAIATTPSRLSSSAFIDCTGLLSLLLGIAALIGGIVTSIQASSLLPLLPAILFTAALAYFGAVALHANLVNVGMSEGTAGEEAIGLLAFFAKAGLKLVPLYFCLLSIGGCLAIVTSFFESGQAFTNAVTAIMQVVPIPVNIPYGFAASGVILFACVLPLAAYFAFLMQYLAIDLARSILSVPGKLDGLRRS